MNHFNLGRYWPDKGPQVTLFAPAPAFKTGANDLFMVELEWASCPNDVCSVNFVRTPYINKPVAVGEVGSRVEMLNEEL